MPSDGFISDAAKQGTDSQDKRVYGVTAATVVNNVDTLGLGRVQINLPFRPDLQPWARVAVPQAGNGRGTYFIPQIGDEVLVAFDKGDVTEPYVIGSLWNSSDSPPVRLPTDATTRRLIRTPLGHDIDFDEVVQTITITTSTKQEISLGPDAIEIKTTGGTASISLDVAGNIKIKGALSISLEAPSISIKGANVEIKGSAAVTVDGGLATTIQGAVVKIN